MESTRYPCPVVLALREKGASSRPIRITLWLLFASFAFEGKRRHSFEISRTGKTRDEYLEFLLENGYQIIR